MAETKPDRPNAPGTASPVADGGIDRYGSWTGRPPADVERRRAQMDKEGQPVAARQATLTRSLNNYVNFRVWTERARAQWDAPAPEGSPPGRFTPYKPPKR